VGVDHTGKVTVDQPVEKPARRTGWAFLALAGFDSILNPHGFYKERFPVRRITSEKKQDPILAKVFCADLESARNGAASDQA